MGNCVSSRAYSDCLSRTFVGFGFCTRETSRKKINNRTVPVNESVEYHLAVADKSPSPMKMGESKVEKPENEGNKEMAVKMEEEEKGAAEEPQPPKPKKPLKMKRQSSAGLMTDSILRKKTGNLRGSYFLERKLGHGQYGTTFLCIEKSTAKEFACKSISKRKLLTMEDVEDVRREIEIMHHLLGSPNVISIKEAFEDAVSVHVVMELCTGGELFDRIVDKGHYSEKDAAELTRTIVGVVEACHSLGVMHRDLKPENFLFIDDKEDSALKSIDFGLSTFFKPGDVFVDVVGSPYYVAPEVLKKCYGIEADVWSAGVITYILLCGVPPFWGGNQHILWCRK